MKKTNIFMMSALLSTSTLLSAQEVVKKRDRISSPRKAIDTMAKMKTKDVGFAQTFKNMFVDGKVSGQVRVINAGYNQKESGVKDTYATALGGILKYELAEFKGFNAAVALYTSHDINFMSGSNDKQNPELSSSDGSYDELGEAYINYKYKDLSFRAGRQTLDTPLVDSDDIRMIQNSFEAYTAKYTYKDVEFLGGYINTWDGFDQDLEDNGFAKIGKRGVGFGGISYAKKYEFNLWYYNITGYTNITYLDGGINYELSKDMKIHALLQYQNESELEKSGYNSSIYGATFEFVLNDLGLNIAYNEADVAYGKQTYTGNGGGALFTSMDTTTIDVVSQGRDSKAVVAGISYGLGGAKFLYAYGDFDSSADLNGAKEHIVEQDIGIEYSLNDDFMLNAVFVMSDDRARDTKSQNDWDRFQLMANYSF